jgi:uncharacterized protein YjbJ (UPF0337 family)
MLFELCDAGSEHFRTQGNGEFAMNWDQIKGDWKNFKGKLREKWGELTDDDVDVINGQREQLVGSLQKRYGVAKEEAQRQVQEFEDACQMSRT